MFGQREPQGQTIPERESNLSIEEMLDELIAPLDPRIANVPVA